MLLALMQGAQQGAAYTLFASLHMHERRMHVIVHLLDRSSMHPQAAEACLRPAAAATFETSASVTRSCVAAH